MVDRNALDLSAIDPPIWRVMVDGAVYGPYTLGQMKVFAEEGRLLDTSKVASGDGGAFLSAFEHKELRSLIPGYTTPIAAAPTEQAANFLITLQSDGDGRRAAIAVLNKAGRFAELMPGCFILHSVMPIKRLREDLSTVLAERGRFVIVNASSGRLAWMGLSPDANDFAKAVWKRDA
ncbi:MAG: hypothetical protein ACX94B_15865 [Henriciella sp.]